MIDRTSLNIVSIVLGSAGLLTALTGFNVPQLRLSFFGENPYQVKRDIIQDVMAWVFGVLAVSALVPQIVGEIAGPAINERLFTTASYIRVATIGSFTTIFLVYALTRLGRRVAKRRWRPVLLRYFGPTIQRAAFALEHGGLFSVHVGDSSSWSEATKEKAASQNLRQIDEQLTMIEDLLELGPIPDRHARVKRLSAQAEPFLNAGDVA